MTTVTSPSMDAQQIKSLTRSLTKSLMSTLVWSAAIGMVVTLIVWLAFRQYSIPLTLDDGTVVDSAGWFAWFVIPLGVAAVSAFVHQIVAGANFTRIPIANGATRRNLTIAHLITVVIGVVVLSAAAFVVYVLEYNFNPDAEMWIGLFGSAEVGIGAAAGFIGLAALTATSAYLFGLAAGVVFLRFHWIVGTTVLVLLFVVLPNIAEIFSWAWYAWFSSGELIPVVIQALLAGAAYILMMRRIEVP